MDLSTFSKETLINMIQDQQKLINEQQKQINSYKIPAIPKQQEVSSHDSYQVYNEDTQQLEPVDKDIVFRLRDEFLKNYEFDLSNQSQDKKIWINMEKHRRPIKNIKEIRPILEKYNFDEVTFEDLTISKKIQILQNTNFLMGSHSSGLANMLFMKKGGNIIDIRDPNDNIKNAFFTLSSELDLNYFYMERESKSSDIIIDPQKLDDLLSSIF